MAARNRPGVGRAWTPERVRERIKVVLLVDRLQKHALGQEPMEATQLKAIEILLRKTVPDLSAIEASGPGGAPIPIMISNTDAEL